LLYDFVTHLWENNNRCQVPSYG